MDKREILEEIKSLEAQETTYQNCTKLAVLYIVADKLKGPEPKSYSYANSSDFIAAASSVDKEILLPILDEHMQAINALYPREYKHLIQKIKKAGQ